MDNILKNKAELLPYHAINEFMRNDFRLSVVRSVLTNLAKLPEDQRNNLQKLTRRHVQVPGFRSSDKAPAVVRVSPTADAFEKYPDVTLAVLLAWADLHPELRQQAFDLLRSRGWEVLPIEADRTKFPGFLIQWPQGEEFEILDKQFKELHPDTIANSDEISLMMVWLSMRLPYKFEELARLNEQMKLPENLEGEESNQSG